MNILVTCLSKAWGGMEMFAISSLRLLINDGYSVSAACIEGSPIHKELQKLNIRLELFDTSLFSLKNIIKFIKMFKSGRYNLIHSHFSKDLWLIVPALKILGSKLPVVLTKHLGSAVNKKDLLHNIIYKRLDYAIAISNVIKNNLLETTALTEDKVALINNYIEVDKYKKNQTAGKKLREEFNLNDNTLVFGLVARITPGKGHEEVIEAVKILAGERLNFKVIVAGTSSTNEKEYEQGLKDLIKEYGIEDYFIFTGFRSDVPDLMSLFDVFLFPSRAEAFGLALLEAMAAELPNIVCYSDGVKDIAIKDVTSLTFSRYDSNTLARQIKRIYVNDQLRERLAKNSFIRAQHFTAAIFQEKINLLYEIATLKPLGKAVRTDKLFADFYNPENDEVPVLRHP